MSSEPHNPHFDLQYKVNSNQAFEIYIYHNQYQE